MCVLLLPLDINLDLNNIMLVQYNNDSSSNNAVLSLRDFKNRTMYSSTNR